MHPKLPMQILAFVGIACGFCLSVRADRPIEVTDVVIDYAVTAEVPARRAGVIDQVFVRRNQFVRKGETLCKLDETTLQIQRRSASLRYEAAKLSLQSDVEVRYAETALDEAQAELDDMEATSDSFRGAIARNQLRRNRLAVQRAGLDLARAEKRREEAQIEVQLRAADLAVIDDQLQQLRCVAPIDGIVLLNECKPGQWARDGETLVTIGSVETLHLHALVSVAQIPPHQCVGRRITVHFNSGHVAEQLEGIVESVDPNRLPGSRFRLHATVKNEPLSNEASPPSPGKPQMQRVSHWKLVPGMQVTMRLHP